MLDIVDQQYILAPDDFDRLWHPEAIAIGDEHDRSARIESGIVTPPELALAAVFGKELHDRWGGVIDEEDTLDRTLSHLRRVAVGGFANSSAHEFGFFAAMALWHERGAGFNILEGYAHYSSAYDGYSRQHILLDPQEIAYEILDSVDNYAKLYEQGFRTSFEVHNATSAEYARGSLQQSLEDMVEEWTKAQPKRDPEVVRAEVVEARERYAYEIARDDARQARV